MYNFDVLGPKFGQKWILGSEFKKINVKTRISMLEIQCVLIFRQNWQLCLFGPKFAQKWILGSEFQIFKSRFGISTSKIPCERIFSENGELWIFRLKFGEIAQLHAIFWFEYCLGCCRELDGGWNELGGGGWSWVELDGAGWSCVHGLVIPLLAKEVTDNCFLMAHTKADKKQGICRYTEYFQKYFNAGDQFKKMTYFRHTSSLNFRYLCLTASAKQILSSG